MTKSKGVLEAKRAQEPHWLRTVPCCECGRKMLPLELEPMVKTLSDTNAVALLNRYNWVRATIGVSPYCGSCFPEIRARLKWAEIQKERRAGR